VVLLEVVMRYERSNCVSQMDPHQRKSSAPDSFP
jgi:hypothetical protein